MQDEETIAAVATPQGIGALAIIRVSGKDAFQIVEEVIKQNEKYKKTPDRYAKKYFIIERETKKIIDEVIAIKYKGPNTYTGENVIEIISHGGYYTVKKIIEELIKNGARIANRGEFSKRAFLNGKINLMKAEAIKALIESKSEKEYKNAINNYDGKGKRIKEWQEKIKQELVFIEAEIEFGDEEKLSERNNNKILEIEQEINEEIKRVNKIIEIRKGYNITIAGPPNAGKSSLFNYLLGYKRAIVNENPGTTRDIIKEKIEINGQEINIIDTAGIRKTNDIIEEEGIDKANEALNEANIIIWITDIGEEIGEVEKQKIKDFQKDCTIFVLNKIDKKSNKNKIDFFKENELQIIEISLKEKRELEKVIKEIEVKLNLISRENKMPDIFVNERQKQIAEGIYKDIKNANIKWKQKEIAAYYLRESLNKIDEIFGKTNNENIINDIFDNFCIGK